MTRLAMLHDMHKCSGCGACLIACKNENNVPEGIYWLNYLTRTTGKFPKVKYEFLLTQCNHCENAPCVKNCPTRSMHKEENGLTLHTAELCIGCKTCIQSCPYNAISYNSQAPHARWHDTKELVPGITSSGKELSDKLKVPIAYYNPDRATTYLGIREKGIVEKCTFCDHRVAKGEQPYCVASCPADARLLGDLDDPSDPIHERMAKVSVKTLRPDRGTSPKVFYLREY